MSTPRLAHASFPIAFAALVISAYGAFRQSSQGGPASACSCPDQDQVAALQVTASGITRAQQGNALELRGIASRLAALESSGAATDAGSRPSREPEQPQDPGRLDDGSPIYVRFDAPRGMRVEQLPTGALSIHNSDPAMTGKTLIVKATTADGTVESVHIMVPPP